LYRPGKPHCRHILWPCAFVGGYDAPATAAVVVVVVGGEAGCAVVVPFVGDPPPVVVVGYLLFLTGAPVTGGANMCVWYICRVPPTGGAFSFDPYDGLRAWGWLWGDDTCTCGGGGGGGWWWYRA